MGTDYTVPWFLWYSLLLCWLCNSLPEGVHLHNCSFMLLKPTSHLFLKFFLTYLAVLCCFFEDQGIGLYELCLVATPASILSCSCVWNVNWGLLFVPLASDVFLTGKTINILYRLEHQWKLSYVFAAVSITMNLLWVKVACIIMSEVEL